MIILAWVCVISFAAAIIAGASRAIAEPEGTKSDKSPAEYIFGIMYELSGIALAIWFLVVL